MIMVTHEVLMKKMKRYYSLKAVEKRKRRLALNKMAIPTTECMLELFCDLKRQGKSL